jgi:hypothetical protein
VAKTITAVSTASSCAAAAPGVSVATETTAFSSPFLQDPNSNSIDTLNKSCSSTRVLQLFLSNHHPKLDGLKNIEF